MSAITRSDVLASMPEGGTVLDILRAYGLPYSLEQKKCLNKLLYAMEKDGILRKHQPNHDKKPMWFRMRKATTPDEALNGANNLVMQRNLTIGLDPFEAITNTSQQEGHADRTTNPCALVESDERIHIDRSVVATLSGTPMLSIILQPKRDVWNAVGSRIATIADNVPDLRKVRTLYIRLFRTSLKTDLVHRLTFRGYGAANIFRVEPFGPQSESDSKGLNSIPLQRLSEHVQQWCPSEHGGVTFDYFRVIFSEETDASDLYMEAVGLTLYDFKQQIRAKSPFSDCLMTFRSVAFTVKEKSDASVA